MHAPTEESTHTHQHHMNMVFANHSKEDVIHPFTAKGICTSPGGLFNPEVTKQNRQYSTRFVEDTQVLCKAGKIVSPKVLQQKAFSWYYHYLQHHGQTCLEETLHAAMYWTGIINTIQSHVKKTVVLVTLTILTQAQVWEIPYKACHHKPLGKVMCGSNTTIHSQR
jgi:hypothetical protein